LSDDSLEYFGLLAGRLKSSVFALFNFPFQPIFSSTYFAWSYLLASPLFVI